MVKIYHASVNECTGYAVAEEWFTNEAELESWVRKWISNYGNIDTNERTIDDLIDEYNGEFRKYSIILARHDFPDLVFRADLVQHKN